MSTRQAQLTIVVMFADPLIWLFFVYVVIDFFLKANNAGTAAVKQKCS